MKNDREILSSVLKTAQMGQTGIRSALHVQMEDTLRQELRRQLSGYDRIERDAYGLAAARGWELEELGIGAKAMAKAVTRAKLSHGNAGQKVASMMIRGNTRGMINGLKNTSGNACTDSGVQSLAENLLEYEKSNIEKMQPYV